MLKIIEERIHFLLQEKKFEVFSSVVTIVDWISILINIVDAILLGHILLNSLRAVHKVYQKAYLNNKKGLIVPLAYLQALTQAT